MHVAFHESIEKTALEADNSAEIIKSNYLDIVTREEAANFWAIYPKNKATDFVPRPIPRSTPGRSRSDSIFSRHAALRVAKSNI
jgi:hypothetical protein